MRESPRMLEFSRSLNSHFSKKKQWGHNKSIQEVEQAKMKARRLRTIFFYKNMSQKANFSMKIHELIECAYRKLFNYTENENSKPTNI